MDPQLYVVLREDGAIQASATIFRSLDAAIATAKGASDSTCRYGVYKLTQTHTYGPCRCCGRRETPL